MQTDNYAFYGFANNNSYDIHMSKDVEWGAVVYLSQSDFGKQGNPNYQGAEKEIYKNNCSLFKTGIAGDTVNAAGSSNCNNTYETPIGKKASTTGNIYGIYDMSGGSWEYLMGAFADENGNPRSGNTTASNSGFNGKLNDNTDYNLGLPCPEQKYYDLYTSDVINKACNGGICYGHALSEVSFWNNNQQAVIYKTEPWRQRGGYYGDRTDFHYTGLFNSHRLSGAPRNINTFRIALVS